MEKKFKIIPILFAISAAFLYAVSSPISKILLEKIPETIMAGILYIGAGLGLSIVSGIKKAVGKSENEKSLDKKDMPYIYGMIIFNIAAPILLMAGLKLSEASSVSLLNNFEIVATSIIAMCIFHEKISKRLWIGICFITISSLILSFNDMSSFSFSLGSLFVLGACTCWGFENNCTRMISSKDPMEIVQIKGYCSGTGSIIIGLLLGNKLEFNIYTIYALLLGFVAYGLSIMFYIYAQRYLGAAKTSAYYAMSPFIGAGLSIILLKEIPSLIFWIALSVMAVGVFFTTFDSSSPEHKISHKHDGVYSIDLYAYESKLKNVNPAFKVCLAFITLIICIAADNIYVSIAVALSMGFITVYLGGLKFHEYISLLKIPGVFMILGSIAIALGVSFKPVGQYNLNLYLFYIYTSNDSILRTLEVIMKAFGAVSAMYMMTLSTNTSEIISVIRKIHVPKIIIELMNMIYRFIFILMDVQCKMKNSAQSRLGYIDFKTSCYSFGNTAANLLVVSLKKANAYYDAMESRCYDGEMIFLEEEKKIKTSHIIYAFIYVALLILIWFI